MATIETVAGTSFSAWDVNASGFVPLIGTGLYSLDYLYVVVGPAAPQNRVVFSSSIGDIAPNGMTFTGTIDGIAIYNSPADPLLNITDFSLSLQALLPFAPTQLENWEALWETVLAGGTTFNLAQSSSGNFMGDFANVTTGQTLAGAVDTFNGVLNSGNYELTGDALFVAVGATLTGGNDNFNFSAVANAGGGANLVLAGDVGQASQISNGTINGGSDTFTINGTSTTNAAVSVGVIIAGDVLLLGAASTLNGGGDTIALTDVAVASIYGDFNQASGAVITGGNDTISFIRTLATAGYSSSSFNEIDGDGGTINGNSLTGGIDTITVTNASGTSVNGDVNQIQNANFTGGADTIAVQSTYATPTYPNSPISIPTVSVISGDAQSTSGSGNVTGGNDSITVNNVNSQYLIGDVYNASNAGFFVGGNDSISEVFYYPSILSSQHFIGDAYGASSTNFTGGNDTLLFNGNLSGGSTSYFIGDLEQSTVAAAATGVFVGGNDTITVNNLNAAASVILVGDMSSSGVQLLTFTGGNDTLKGGAGNDYLYGDSTGSVTATVMVGGNDNLDGRGGNDLIDGGLGNDTASFASLAQAVYVDLQGIYNGSATPYEAMGQGFDQFVSIENVTGSIMNDTILGDSGANIITGGAGNDTMTGRGGADIYYVDSALDRVIEGVGGGSDRIYTTVSYTLAAGQEVEIISTNNNSGTTAINITGNEFNSSIAGNAGINTLNGGGGNDTLYGYGGADTLIGGTGNGVDNLYGGDGNDTLTGGAGADNFFFNFALNATTNRDTITDFVVVDDTIKLDHLFFATLGVGALNPNAFFSSATGTAHDADDRIIYNTTTGVLTYDSNGNTAGGDIAFATLTGAPAGLTSLDFVVI